MTTFFVNYGYINSMAYCWRIKKRKRRIDFPYFVINKHDLPSRSEGRPNCLSLHVHKDKIQEEWIMVDAAQVKYEQFERGQESWLALQNDKYEGLDMEWVLLLLEAKKMGISPQEVRRFLGNK